MSAQTAAGVLLVALPVAFNAVFGRLAATFDYPDVLRREPREVLAAFRAGGTALVTTWWLFSMTAVLLVPTAVVLAGALPGADPVLTATGAAVGAFAGAVQALGLVRWPFAVPLLARLDAEGRDVDVAFALLNRLLGVGVGEHLGYLLTGTWTLLAGAAMTQSDVVPAVLGWLALPIGAVLALCSLEFVGRFEREGWALAGRVVPGAYVAWSLWLAATGIALLV